MRDQIEVVPNDTTRALQKIVKNLKKWKDGNDRANQREVALVITKLEEAILWSYAMVKHEDLQNLVTGE